MGGKPRKPTSHFQCGVLPYIQLTDGPLSFGDVEIWPNSASEWKHRVGWDHTELTKIYLDREGRVLGEQASVISLASGGTGNFTTLKDHVVALSTLAWLDCHACRGADAWVVDFWSLPRKTLGNYSRHGKFSTLYTNSKHEKIYMPLLTRTYRFRDPGGPLKSSLEAELRKDRSESILHSLTYFYLSRFELPWYSIPGADIETMWSGFESIYLNQSSPDEPDQSKAERLYQEVCQSFSSVTKLSREVKNRLKKWTKKFYLSRNLHTHGRGVEGKDTYMREFDTDAYEIGLRVAEGELLVRLGAGSADYSRRAIQGVESTFMWKEQTTEMLNLLDRYDRKHWYPGPADPDELRRLGMLMKEFEHHQRFAKIDKDKGREVAKKMVLVLSAWTDELAKEQPSGINLESVAWLPSKFTDLLNRKREGGVTESKIIQELAGEFRYRNAAERTSYCQGAVPPSLFLGGEIAIFDWIGCYMDLCDVLWAAR